jgi:hypothetical protein
MRSRRTYTQEQASAVIRLLHHRLSASRQQQKLDRNQLRRRYGFWISEFWVGFSDRDFRAKVADGTFKIAG